MCLVKVGQPNARSTGCGRDLDTTIAVADDDRAGGRARERRVDKHTVRPRQVDFEATSGANSGNTAGGPGRGEGRKQLRFWSAGCCTGEEPYSLAILLREILPDIDEWQITLLATDINPVFLRKAAAGVYGNWSFRDAPAGLRERWFRPEGPHRHGLDPARQRAWDEDVRGWLVELESYGSK